MVCNFYKYKKEVATSYVSEKTGNKYPRNEYYPIGRGNIERGRKDLPIDEYPYVMEYKTEQVWLFCELCSCECKEIKI